MLQVTCYSVLCSTFSDNIQGIITKIEIIVGCGLGAGPFLSGYLGQELGYEITQYAFGCLSLAALLVCIVCLPSALNNTVSDEEIAAFEAEMEDLMAIGVEDEQRKKIQISLWTVLCNRHSFFVLLICFFGIVNCTFFIEWIAVNLEDDYDFSEAFGGYMLALLSISYLIGCLLLPYTCEHAPRKFMFVVAYLCMAGSMVLLGPSKMFKLPGPPENKDVYWPVVAAFPLLGFCQIFVFIPIIPEMLERIQVDNDISEVSDGEIYNDLNDRVNDAYGLVYALANFFSPLVGSMLNRNFG